MNNELAGLAVLTTNYCIPKDMRNIVLTGEGETIDN